MNNSGNIVKSNKEFWLVDQIIYSHVSEAEYINGFNRLFNDWKMESGGYLSILMEEKYEDVMLNNGLRKISNTVEYTRTLDVLADTDSKFYPHALSEPLLSDDAFARLYEQCRSGSFNQNIPQSIETVMDSLKRELGVNWRNHCFYFAYEGEIVGLAIPHLEKGTSGEGRLFYFGLVPKWRGKGIGASIHNHALKLMKGLNAQTYVGSTDVNNQYMIKIFEKNGCTLRNVKGIYRFDCASNQCRKDD